MNINQLSKEIEDGRIIKIEIINNQTANEDRYEICLINSDETKLFLTINGKVKIYKSQYAAITAVKNRLDR